MKLNITVVTDEGEPIEPKTVARRFVSQCGVIVRERVPISIQKWKSTDPSDQNVLPQTEKDMLWSDITEIFSFPKDADQDKIRDWTMKKMAILFQDHKKKLYKTYLKTGEAPKFDSHPNLTPEAWESFLEYKRSEDGIKLTVQNTTNAGDVKYPHHMGSSGYKGNIDKWNKMEEDLYARGIRPETHDWPLRSKHWYYGHGGKLSPIDGSLIFGDELRELAQRLLDIIRKSERGEFIPDRDRDELTYALGNKEHPGRTRGIGVIPWKHGFKDDISSYRSRKRKKAEVEDRMRELEATVAAQGSRIAEMEENQEQRLKVALLQIQAAPGKEATHDTTPPTLRSSIGSIDQAPVQETLRHPVDQITQRTACELHVRTRNLSVPVAYGMVSPIQPGQTVHCREIPNGFAPVEVEQVVSTYNDMELEIPGGDGETKLGRSCHCIILWRKSDIIIPGFQSSPMQAPGST